MGSCWTPALDQCLLLAAHPDYLPYFNALAGSNPERIVVDSDLDWGQDLKRLGRRLKELGAPSVAFTPTIYTSFATLGFPPWYPTNRMRRSPVGTPSSSPSGNCTDLGFRGNNPGSRFGPRGLVR